MRLSLKIASGLLAIGAAGSYLAAAELEIPVAMAKEQEKILQQNIQTADRILIDGANSKAEEIKLEKLEETMESMANALKGEVKEKFEAAAQLRFSEVIAKIKKKTDIYFIIDRSGSMVKKDEPCHKHIDGDWTIFDNVKVIARMFASTANAWDPTGVDYLFFDHEISAVKHADTPRAFISAFSDKDSQPRIISSSVLRSI